MNTLKLYRFSSPIQLQPLEANPNTTSEEGSLFYSSTDNAVKLREENSWEDLATKKYVSGYVEDELNKLELGNSNLLIVSKSDNDMIRWNASVGKWQNEATLKSRNGEADRVIGTNSNGYLDETFLQYNINLNNHTIYGLQEPVSDGQAATKFYADHQIMGNANIYLAQLEINDFLRWNGFEWQNVEAVQTAANAGILQDEIISTNEFGRLDSSFLHYYINMNGNTFYNLRNPTSDYEPATKAYADLSVAKSGDTMSGNLSIPEPTSGSHATTKSYVDGKISDTRTYIDDKNNQQNTVINSKVNRSGDTMEGALNLSRSPQNSMEAATKGYVDSLIQGLRPKQIVQAATTENISRVGHKNIDGVDVGPGNRVLVKNQDNPTENGIYLVLGDIDSWLRAFDMDAWNEVPGAYVFVEKGNNYAETGWVCTSDFGGEIGSSDINWVQFAGPGSIVTDHQGLEVSVNQLYLELDGGTLTKSLLGLKVATGGIRNNEIAGDAEIADTKLGTISTGGKVSNSATTATSNADNNTIVSRDGNGNFAANKVILKQDPDGNDQATHKGYVDGRIDTRVAKSGDTMTGHLTLHADPVSEMQAVTKQYVDNGNNSQNAAINSKINRSGDTMEGFLTLNANPTEPMHAATKQYVNSTISWTTDGQGIEVNESTRVLTLELDGGTLTKSGNGLKVSDSGITDTQLAGNISDGKLATITSSGKVSNSATTATPDANANTIVSRNGDGNFAANKVILKQNPDGDDQATHKGYVDGRIDTRVAKGGDTMTGHLTLHADPSNAMHAVTKQYVDSGNNSQNDVINSKVNRSGDSMGGFLTLHSDPTEPMHAATKQYVNSTISWTTDGNGITVSPSRVLSLVLDGGTLTKSGNGLKVSDSGITDTQLAGNISDGKLATITSGGKVANSATTATPDANANTIVSRNGDGNFAANKVILKQNPDGDDQATHKGYVDGRIDTRVAKGGDTMTGHLTLHADPSSAMHAVTKQYVDNGNNSQNDVINSKVNRSGDSMGGFLTLHANPTEPMHAATKNYVNTTISWSTDGQGIEISESTRILSLELDGGTLTKSGNGLKVSDSGITDTQLAGNISDGKLATITSSGKVSNSATTATSNADNNTIVSRDGNGNFAANKVILKQDPTGDDQATHKGYVDGRINFVNGRIDDRVSKSGDTMTGRLTLSDDPSSGMHAVTKQYVDGGLSPKLNRSGDTMEGFLTLNAYPSDTLHAAPKGYVDERILRSGDGMTGFLSLHADPALDEHASTKRYVDQKVLNNQSTFIGTATSDGIPRASTSYDGSDGTITQKATSFKTAPSNTEQLATLSLTQSIADRGTTAPVTETDITNLGTTSTELSQYLNKPEEEIAAMTLGELQTAIKLEEGKTMLTQSYAANLLLAASTTGPVQFATYSKVQFAGAKFEYRLKDSTSGHVRIGTIYIGSTDTSASVTDFFSETGEMEINWSSQISADNVQLIYDNFGVTDKFMHLDAKYFPN